MTLLGYCQRRGLIVDFPILKAEHASNAQRSFTLRASWKITFPFLRKLEAVRVIIYHLLSTAVQLLKSPLEVERKSSFSTEG